MPEETTVDQGFVDGEATPDSGPTLDDMIAEAAREYGGAVQDPEIPESDGQDVGSNEQLDTGQANEDSDSPWRGSKPGTDEVIRAVRDSLGEDAAEVVRGIQSNANRSLQETKDLQTQLIESLQEVERIKENPAPKRKVARGRRAAQAEGEESPTKRSYNPQQRNLIKQVLEDEGVITKAAVEAEKAAEQSDTYVLDAMKKGVEQYGAQFGEVQDDGDVVLSDSMQEKLRPILERIDQSGYTPLDLAMIAGVVPIENANNANIDRDTNNLQRANVTRQSSSGMNQPRTGRPDANGLSPDEAIDRFWSQAKRELRHLRV